MGPWGPRGPRGHKRVGHKGVTEHADQSWEAHSFSRASQGSTHHLRGLSPLLFSLSV